MYAIPKNVLQVSLNELLQSDNYSKEVKTIATNLLPCLQSKEGKKLTSWLVNPQEALVLIHIGAPIYLYGRYPLTASLYSVSILSEVSKEAKPE